jgi:hypothetical protein
MLLGEQVQCLYLVTQPFFQMFTAPVSVADTVAYQQQIDCKQWEINQFLSYLTTLFQLLKIQGNKLHDLY